MLLPARDVDANVLTISEVLERLKKDPRLADHRRQHLRVALLALVKHTRLDPSRTKASYSACRGAILRFKPASANVSELWWRRVQAHVSSTFNRYGGASYYTKGDPLSPHWQRLRDHLNDRQFVRRLVRFIRYCNHLNVAPSDVSDEVSEAFFRYLSEGTSIANPKKRHRQTCQDWNRACDTIPGWPQVRLTVPVYHPRFTLPLSAFPRSFVVDLDAWCTAGETTDPLGARTPRRPLQPITIATNRRVLRYFASALVRAGTPVAAIADIAALVKPTEFEKGIAYLWKRAGCQRSKWLSAVANELANVAKFWVGIDPARYTAMRKVANRLTPPRDVGITAKNRRILRQFDDPENVHKLLNLPKLLASTASKARGPERAAYLMQMAIAVELLLVAPIRIGSLHILRRSANLAFAPSRGQRPGAVYLIIPAANVKNAVPLEFELPIETCAMLDRYIRRYLPLLTAPPADVLFPGATEGPKQASGLATQIKQTIASYTGLEVNVHAFRHIAARLYLERFPQEYFLVGLLLGQRSVLTTMWNYCELGVRPAARQYSEHVLGRHFLTRCKATARFGANRMRALHQAQVGWRWT